MEIEFTNSGSPATSSRHASPFHHTMMSNTSTSSTNDLLGNPSGPSSSIRKRQRSNTHSTFYHDTIRDENEEAEGNSMLETSEDEDAPRIRAKRRNLTTSTTGRDDNITSHYYHALGSGVADLDAETGEAMTGIGTQEGVGSMYDASEYGVDSPMNLLRLISRSPSLEDSLQVEGRGANDDIEMTVGGNESLTSSKIDSLNNSRQSSSSSAQFLPRQVRNSQLRNNANTPVRPSPLAQQADDFGSNGSSDSSPRLKMMERSNSNTSQESTFSLRRSLTQSSIQRSSSTTMMTAETNVIKRMSYDDQGNIPLRRTSRYDRIIRTPSPMPQQMTNNENENQEESQNTSIRTQHPSPGMNSSAFPGGKQMLRYTMGYRDDCEQCKNKVPGHYGHVVHRTN